MKENISLNGQKIKNFQKKKKREKEINREINKNFIHYKKVN